MALRTAGSAAVDDATPDCSPSIGLACALGPARCACKPRGCSRLPQAEIAPYTQGSTAGEARTLPCYLGRAGVWEVAPAEQGWTRRASRGQPASTPAGPAPALRHAARHGPCPARRGGARAVLGRALWGSCGGQAWGGKGGAPPRQEGHLSRQTMPTRPLTQDGQYCCQGNIAGHDNLPVHWIGQQFDIWRKECSAPAAVWHHKLLHQRCFL